MNTVLLLEDKTALNIVKDEFNNCNDKDAQYILNKLFCEKVINIKQHELNNLFILNNCDKIKDKKIDINILKKIHTNISEIINDPINNYIIPEKDQINEHLKLEIFSLLLQRTTASKSDATELLVQSILTNEHIYTIRQDNNQELWIYKDGIYKPEGISYIKQFCRNILDTAYTTQLLNQIIAKIEADTFIEQNEFFIEEDVNLIPVDNGILNIKTKELQPFNPKYKFFNKLPVKFNTDKKCPAILEFLNDVLGNKDDINLIQEIMGYLLYRDYKYEKSFMFLGGGRNGKGKTLELMKRFIGIENCSNVSLSDLERDMFSRYELFKKLANLSGDISKKALVDTNHFKSLTGHDLQGAPRKNKTRINFTNYAKMLFAVNELPVTYDLTEAFFDRWILINFPFTFKEQHEIDAAEDKTRLKLKDTEKIEKISTPDELSGLLNWALDGFNKLLKNDKFSYSTSTSEVKRKWLRTSSSLLAFIEDEVEKDFKSEISKSEFKDEYFKYCIENDIKLESDKRINYVLTTDMGCSLFQNSSDGKRYWSGIKFKKNKIISDMNQFEV